MNLHKRLFETQPEENRLNAVRPSTSGTLRPEEKPAIVDERVGKIKKEKFFTSGAHSLADASVPAPVRSRTGGMARECGRDNRYRDEASKEN